MIDHEDAYRDDQMPMGRGLIIGVLMGAVMWAVIIGGFLYLVN
ncbi:MULTISPECIES: hypothetical protein [Paenibacillus]|nr:MULTISPECIES: hypothetical protein [Paenibacillus]EGL16427.1 hypothetical protein HMPREF9413_1687 [Paenibacillus sp. HGF7]EPD83868.1 hypothetical protein HMPREF1207_03232 [Paenibacillus sp. HGH0039]MEC0245098.1 hypothetical protein [Paenibacillus chitinolyticus]SEG70643.1 hypothetical protein SAMN02799616_04416 [Paenibacillus sp. UNC499MF]